MGHAANRPTPSRRHGQNPESCTNRGSRRGSGPERILHTRRRPRRCSDRTVPRRHRSIFGMPGDDPSGRHPATRLAMEPRSHDECWPGSAANREPGNSFFASWRPCVEGLSDSMLSAGSRAFQPQTRSKIPAAPMPVPTHIVTMPYFWSRRCRPWISLVDSTAPVAPRG